MIDGGVGNIDDQKYRAVIQNSHDAVMIFDVDRGRFIDYNQNTLDLLKISGDVFTTLHPIDISPQKLLGHPAAEFANKYINEALNGGNPFFEWIHLDTAGNEIPCQIRLVRFPPFDRRVVRASIIDLRNQKEIEKVLQENEERLKLTLESTGLACFDWYTDKSILHWDDKTFKMFDLPVSSRINKVKAFFKILLKEDRQAFLNKYQELLSPNNDSDSYIYEFRIRINDQVKEVVTRGSVYRNADGNVERIIGTLKDVSVERAAEREKIRTSQLEAKNKELEQFAYIASHDLQAPLNTISGLIKLLEQEIEVHELESLKEYCGLIDQSLHRMFTLIKDLLSYARIGTNPSKEEIDLEALIVQQINQFKQTDPQVNIQYESELEIKKINANRTELQLLIQNLFSNAIKFRRKSDTCSIHFSSKKGKNSNHEFCVTDDGIGIDSKYHDSIFDLFQRLHTQDECEGTGIGLAHCKKIVESYGGKIWLESSPGKGSRFHFTLP
ncbi:MAG: PAS domain-containing protein [Saprospiraceae bacterium]|nr:PAS domain-containing protein [Saprospiraceae bacterium]